VGRKRRVSGCFGEFNQSFPGLLVTKGSETPESRTKHQAANAKVAVSILQQSGFFCQALRQIVIAINNSHRKLNEKHTKIE
jgi:hypothetical protein